MLTQGDLENGVGRSCFALSIRHQKSPSGNRVGFSNNTGVSRILVAVQTVSTLRFNPHHDSLIFGSHLPY